MSGDMLQAVPLGEAVAGARAEATTKGVGLSDPLLAPDLSLPPHITPLPNRSGVTPALNAALRPLQPPDSSLDVFSAREPLAWPGQRPLPQGGSSVALQGVGYSSGALNPTQWHLRQQNRAQDVHKQLEHAYRLRGSCRTSEVETSAITRKLQETVTAGLDDRLRDILTAKEELSEGIAHCRNEMALLTDTADTLQRSVRAVFSAGRTTQECCGVRQLRLGEDRTHDQTTHVLQQEVQTEQTSLQLLQKLAQQVEEQVARLRDLKRQLELEWSDKQESFQLDHGAAKLVHDPRQAHFKVSAGRQEGSSDPEGWRGRVVALLEAVKEEVQRGGLLRATAAQGIRETAADLVRCSDAVSSALTRRLAELEQAKDGLISSAHKVLLECEEQERSISKLQQELRLKEGPLQVAQTRVWLRGMRPGLDKCLDHPHHSLQQELDTLPRSISDLRERLRESESALTDLQATHTDLLSAIATKEHTLSLERRVTLIRHGLPTTALLHGLTMG